MNKMVKIDAKQASNSAAELIGMSNPYRVKVQITGTSSMLLHRYDPDSVEAKGKAAKNSTQKKTDDLETYIYRNDKGEICLPGEYLRMSIVQAARFRADPRSPRKSAMDLFKAGIVCATELASLGTKTWDYEDRRRVMVSRQGITRTRPAFKAGWKATFDLEVITPEYIDETVLHEVITTAGRLIGVADYRPTYGRFGITRFSVE